MRHRNERQFTFTSTICFFCQLYVYLSEWGSLRDGNGMRNVSIVDGDEKITSYFQHSCNDSKLIMQDNIFIKCLCNRLVVQYHYVIRDIKTSEISFAGDCLTKGIMGISLNT